MRDLAEVSPGRVGTREFRRRCWWSAFVLVAGLISAWALATPIFASPDEPAHAIHAIGAAHGEWLGTRFSAGHGPPIPAEIKQPWKPGLAVEVPGTYQRWANIQCLAFRPDTTASCLHLDSSTGDKSAFTYTARYMPAYYAAVGSASLITSPGARQIYLMRVFSALLSAALIASAVVTIMEFVPAPLALTGLALAVTPMTLFIAASINPNGLEIAAAIAIWVHGIVIATNRLPLLGNRIVTRLGIAAVVLALNRPLSLLWIAIIAVLLACSAGWLTIREFIRNRTTIFWAGGLVVAIVLQVSWSLWAGTYNLTSYVAGTPSNATTSQVLRSTIGEGYELLRQMIGVFGWLDTPAPAISLLLWLFGLAALGIIAVLAAPRLLRILLATVIVVIAIPTVIEPIYGHTLGYAWQGRYSLPVAVGIPILAGIGAALGHDRVARSRRVVAIIMIGLAVAQFLAFAQALRRYMVGANGTIWFPWSAGWKPPIPALLLLAVFAALLVAGTALVVTSDRFTTGRVYGSASAVSLSD